MPKLQFKFFIKKRGCKNCESAKSIIVDLSNSGEKVEVYYLDDDLVTADTLAEASYFAIQATPTLVVLRDASNGKSADIIVGKIIGEINMDTLNKILNTELGNEQDANPG